MNDREPAGRPAARLFMHEHLEALPDDASVLDLGCGEGSFRYADHPRLKIVAVDVVRPASLGTWPDHARFHRGTVEHLPFPAGTFSLCIANFVFEHTENFARAIVEAERVLKPGGSLCLAVPNARSFEDELYRALFAGSGHLQRFGFRGILRTVYQHTGLKLMAFADWPAGFTYFEGREGLRQFVLAVVSASRWSGRGDLALRSNFMMSFRKDDGTGYRHISRVCSYCGSGDVEASQEVDDGFPFKCRTCGRATEPQRLSLADLDRLEAEMQEFRAAYPLLRLRLTGVPLRLRRWVARALARLLPRRP